MSRVSIASAEPPTPHKKLNDLHESQDPSRKKWGGPDPLGPTAGDAAANSTNMHEKKRYQNINNFPQTHYYSRTVKTMEKTMEKRR